MRQILDNLVNDDPFESPKLLAAEALSYCSELHAAEFEYLDRCPPRLVRYPNVSLGAEVFAYRPQSQPPSRARVIASRILNDLRNALDQAVVAASKELGGSGNKIYYPFCQSPTEFQALFKPKARCSGIPEALRPFLFTLQPYPTSEEWEGGDDLLRSLGYMANPNKHEVTLRVAANAGSARLDYLKNLGGGEIAIIMAMAYTGKEYVMFHVPFGTNFSYKATVQFFLAFEEAGRLSDGPATDILHELATKIGGIVLSLEMETARLKCHS